MKNAKGLTTYHEPMRFGYPAIASGSILVWIPKYLLPEKYRKRKTRYAQMPVVICGWLNRRLEVVDMVYQSLQ